MSVMLDDVTLGYERHPAVHHLTGTFTRGSLTAVVGPNGAGKSTLLKGLKGMLPILAGNIRWAETDRRKVAYLPQQAELDPDFPISVSDVVMLGHWGRIGAFGAETPDLRARASEALAAVGLTGFERRPVAALSIGQRQRILFARVLLQDAPTILLDEPFAAIDARTTADLLAMIGRWHGEGRTVIAVLHDLDQVRAHFPHTLMLAREAIAWGETSAVLTPGNVDRMRRMGEAWDDNAAICRRGA